MANKIKIFSVLIFSALFISGYYIYYQENAVVEMLARESLKSIAISNAVPNYPRPMFVEHIKNKRPWNDSSNQLNDKLFQTLKVEFAQQGIELLPSYQSERINRGICKKGVVFSGIDSIDRYKYGQILTLGPIKWINPFTIHIQVSSYAGSLAHSSYTLILEFKDWKWTETGSLNFIIS